MALELDPADLVLGFQRPYNRERAQTLRLRNPTGDAIAFKVKTTAPKQYCVRPNSGKIQPGDTVEVSVILQPMRDEPPLDARCKDKFLVQSAAIPDDEQDLQWSDLEKNKGQIQERKIRVQYLAANGANGVDEHADRPADDHVDDSLVSPPPQYTPRAVSGGGGTSGASDLREDEKAHEPLQPQPQQARLPGPSEYGRGATTTAAESPRAAAAPAGAASMAVPREELLERLREADATVARLRRELDEKAARRRKEDVGNEKGAAVPGGLAVRTESGEVGVPLRVVFILCLVIFLLTWLMF